MDELELTLESATFSFFVFPLVDDLAWYINVKKNQQVSN